MDSLTSEKDDVKLQACRRMDSLTSEKDVKLQAYRFRDLKIKDFISTYSTVLPGEPRKTKHHGGSKSNQN